MGEEAKGTSLDMGLGSRILGQNALHPLPFRHNVTQVPGQLSTGKKSTKC